MNPARILVVEDDRVLLKVLESKLRAEGYDVICAFSSPEAMHAVQEKRPDLLILDLSLFADGQFNGLVDGFSLLNWMRYTLGDADFPVIIYTGDISPEIEARALACKVDAVFRKGDSLDLLLDAVCEALEQRTLKRESASTF